MTQMIVNSILTPDLTHIEDAKFKIHTVSGSGSNTSIRFEKDVDGGRVLVLNLTYVEPGDYSYKKESDNWEFKLELKLDAHINTFAMGMYSYLTFKTKLKSMESLAKVWSEADVKN